MAILAARVCQLYPNAAPSTLLQKFFTVWDIWKWPMPVLLAPIVDESLGLKIWDPRKNPIDKRDLMPIITPTYPCQNSTYAVTGSTLHIMKAEFARGAMICNVSCTFCFLPSFIFEFPDHSNVLSFPGYCRGEEHVRGSPTEDRLLPAVQELFTN